MLFENLYQVKALEKKDDENLYLYRILINKNHDVFKGHFPGNPVMPGVCMMQIIKELTESITEKKLFMEKCSNVKFMALINPKKHPILSLELKVSENEGKITVKNTTKFDNTIAIKLFAQYKIL